MAGRAALPHHAALLRERRAAPRPHLRDRGRRRARALLARARPRRCSSLTGTDEHGDKIAQAAAAAGVTPQAHVDRVSGALPHDVGRGRAPLRPLHPHDRRATTSRSCSEVLAEIHAAGDIYFGSYTRPLLLRLRALLPGARAGRTGSAPTTGRRRPRSRRRTTSSAWARTRSGCSRLLEAQPDLIVPDGYRREVLALLREPIGDLCISRPKSRLAWGIELPFDDRYVTYVWFDALLNYVSALDHLGTHRTLWPRGAAPDRQGHPEAARRLLADDADGGRPAALPPPLRARPLADAARARCRRASATSCARSTCRRATAWTRSATTCCARWPSARTPTSARRRSSRGSTPTSPTASATSRAACSRCSSATSQGELQPLDAGARRPGAARGVRRRRAASSTRTSRQLAFHRGARGRSGARSTTPTSTSSRPRPFTLAKDPAQRPRVGAILHELCEALRVDGAARRAVPARDGGAPRRLARPPARARLGRARPALGRRPSPPGHRDARRPSRSSRASSCRADVTAVARRLALPRRRAGVRRRPRRGAGARRRGRRDDHRLRRRDRARRAQRARRSRSPGGTARVDVVATVGIHPHDASDRRRRRLRDARRRSPAAPGVVAVGETGLDFHYDHSPRPAQREAFARTSRWRARCGLPLVVHVREAHAEAADAPARRGRRGRRRRHPLLHRRPRRRAPLPRPRLPRLGRRHRDLQERRRASATPCGTCRSTACWSRPTRPTSRRSRTAAGATSRRTSAWWPRRVAAVRGEPFAAVAAATTANARLFRL